MDRNLCGIYFRVQDEKGKWINKCFTDLTAEQKHEVMKDRNTEWLKSLCVKLADTVKEIGNTLDITMGD